EVRYRLSVDSFRLALMALRRAEAPYSTAQRSHTRQSLRYAFPRVGRTRLASMLCMRSRISAGRLTAVPATSVVASPVCMPRVSGPIIRFISVARTRVAFDAHPLPAHVPWKASRRHALHALAASPCQPSSEPPTRSAALDPSAVLHM